MDFTFELSKIYSVVPFEILKQDKDEVIMLLNYMAEKSEAADTRAPVVGKSEKEESAAFWAAL